MLPVGRQKLSELVRGSGDVIRVGDAVRVLGLDRARAAKLLSRWVEQGWLRRVARGAYVAATLDSLNSENVLADPWIIVPSLFPKSYIGGRTAAEHWDLTEQIFNDVVVFTSQSVRRRSQRQQGVTFALKPIDETRIFGTKNVWRGRSKVAVSDVHRTIVDMLDDPSVGGGVRQVADCLTAYLHRNDRDDGTLVSYAERLGNGAVFKRLGFLVEEDPGAANLAAACHARMSKGKAKLDPSMDCPRLATRWQLWIPRHWQTGQQS